MRKSFILLSFLAVCAVEISGVYGNNNDEDRYLHIMARYSDSSMNYQDELLFDSEEEELVKLRSKMDNQKRTLTDKEIDRAGYQLNGDFTDKTVLIQVLEDSQMKTRFVFHRNGQLSVTVTDYQYDYQSTARGNWRIIEKYATRQDF